MKFEYRKWWIKLLLGIITLLSGLIFAARPQTSTIFLNYSFGICLLFISIKCFLETIYFEKFLIKKIINFTKSFFILLFFIFIMINPYAGIKILTCFLIAFLCFDGIFKLFFGKYYRWNYEKNWILFSGALSLFLGLILMMSLPEISKYTLGLFCGASLIGISIHLIFDAYELKEIDKIFSN